MLKIVQNHVQTLNKCLLYYLSFRRSLATKCVFLNYKPCITRPALTDLSPVELNCYPFIITLDKCNGSFNAVDDLSTKISVSSETKAMNVKVFNMKIRVNKAKTLVKHISSNC